MSNPQEKKSGDLPIPALASILFASLAVLAQQLMPLESPRPTTPSPVHYFYQNIEDVNVRLWQDPFTAITLYEASCAATKKCSHQNHKISDLHSSITNHSKPVTVMGVMVPGGPAVDNVEWRRRSRYAVLSGLAVQEYAPEDAEHIGYFNRPENSRDFFKLPEKIPFEWLNAVDGKSSVLLLWLDETAFSSTSAPLETTQLLVDILKKTDSSLVFKFIGPVSTGTLQLMVNELKSSQQKRYTFEFYDASASGDWPGMNVPLAQAPENNEKPWLQLYLEELKLSSLITRTSLTDYQLAKSIVNELKLRGLEINPYSLCNKEQEQEQGSCKARNNKDHIVIISEWDTLYGRVSLPGAMKEALVPATTTHCLAKKKNENECYQNNWIHLFSYMRGLDGVTPDGDKSEEKKSGNNKDDTSNNKPAQERPEGQSQKDYLRRLAIQIGDLERNLESNGEGHINAIGVLGSDAYDKLMVLESLRARFPRALFFTTDVDTRLMHPDDFDVTRNLIVAASFDLQLDSSLQKSIPPFRDSYQTAQFLATQIALYNAKERPIDNHTNTRIDQEKINKFLGNARLFETSHYKAIGLNNEGGDCNTLEQCNNIHPPKPAKSGGKFFFAAIVAFFVALMTFISILSKRCRKALIITASFNLVSGILLFGVVNQGCRRKLNKLPRFVRACIVANSGLLRLAYSKKLKAWVRVLFLLFPQFFVAVVLAIIGYEFSLGDQGEPFYWTEGISVWPSEIIRLFAGVLGCLFIANTLSVLERNKRQLSKKFFSIERLLCYPFNERQIVRNSGTVNRLNAKRLWQWYCWKTSVHQCAPRVTVLSLIFLLLTCSLIYVFDLPNVPYRGAASILANRLVLAFSVTIFIILVMTVIDTTWRCVELIAKLNAHTTLWSYQTLYRFALRPARADRNTPDYIDLSTLRNKLIKCDKYHLDEWLDIEFIAEHTKVVGKLVYYPFIMLVLMMFARSKIFDNWDIPLGLALIFLSSAGLCVACAFYLRNAAEQSRQVILRKINDMKIALSLEPESSARSTLEKQIDMVTEQIEKINEGAFLPFTQEPAFQALLLPFGGWGGITLLEAFVLKGF